MSALATSAKMLLLFVFAIDFCFALFYYFSAAPRRAARQLLFYACAPTYK
jgi:hypothetical protein